MAQEERSELVRQATAAISSADTADDLRQVWGRFYPLLGHRALGRLLLRTGFEKAADSREDTGGQAEPVDPHAISMEIERHVSPPRAFTIEGLADFMEPDMERESLRRVLSDHDELVSLGPDQSGDIYFVPKRALFGWFRSLSFRLARVRQARLSERQLALAMSSLRARGRWNTTPARAIEFGQRFGFCAPGWAPREYVFPISKVLSHLPARSAERALSILEALLGAKMDAVPLDAILKAAKEAVSDLPPRQARVLQARAGLQRRRMTLQAIGAALGLTRQRVRQLQEKAWERIQHPSRQVSLIVALLGYVMHRQGSLIATTPSPAMRFLRFVCACTGVPHLELRRDGLTLLGASRQDAEALDSVWSFPDAMDVETLASRLDSESGLCLKGTDLIAVGEAIGRARRKRLNKAQKVYLALREIGSPAHYSTVAEEYNRLFPHDPSTERSIHAVLGREEYGVVWIGVRGTFALDEWGYEHPSKGLFEAVTEIVTNRYNATTRPVPFAVIAGEIGKYRRVVKLSSVTIAAHCNPSLKRVAADSFIPRPPGDEYQEEIAADELDRILREFESRSGD